MSLQCIGDALILIASKENHVEHFVVGLSPIYNVRCKNH
jgi:hypothetical protein